MDRFRQCSSQILGVTSLDLGFRENHVMEIQIGKIDINVDAAIL